MITFNSDPDLWKSLTKEQIWTEIKKDPILSDMVKYLVKEGMMDKPEGKVWVSRPRMYVSTSKD